MINQRIKELRQIMMQKGIDAYYIPTDDFHSSEYVGEYFKCRAYMSNFNGSAGYLLITQQEALLWTDARYFIIAANAIKDTEIKLMKIGEPGVETLEEYLQNHLSASDTLGFDGRVVSAAQAEQLKKQLDVIYKTDEDLVDMIWKDRPSLSEKPAYYLEENLTGKTTEEKLKDIREKMKENGADVHIVSALDDLAWIFNMRGDDVHCCPVVLSYAVIFQDKAALFIDKNKCDKKLLVNFEKCHVEVYPYHDVYIYLKQLSAQYTYMIDKKFINLQLLDSIPGKIVDTVNPSRMMKAIKNPIEIENTKWAHVMDGVAVTRFMIWIKDEIKKREISELEAAAKLQEFREQWEDLIELSFDTIAGYGANGASMHYTASEESYAMCQAKDLLLVDSGGTYRHGTTDITRTFMLGETSQTIKEHYTMVLRSHIDLAKAQFLYGSSGPTLDGICRQPFWEKGLDFKHGTGHGVGHVLNVHEGPNNFYWNPSRGLCVFEEGMITTDEPGYYEEGSHGIRIENELLCVKDVKNEYGQFMRFESLTLCPYDLDPVLKNELTNDEKMWLNNYHREVFEKLSPYMNSYEVEKLKEYTRKI